MRCILLAFICFAISSTHGQTIHFEPMKGFEINSAYYTPDQFQFRGKTYLLDNAGLQILVNGNWKYIPINLTRNSTIRPGVAVSNTAYAFFTSSNNNKPDWKLNVCNNENNELVARNLPAPYNEYALFDLGFAGNTLFITVSASESSPLILLSSVDFGITWQISPLSGLIEKYFYESHGNIFFTVENSSKPLTSISYSDGTNYEVLSLNGLESEGYSRGKIKELNHEFYWVLSSSIFDASTRLYKYNAILSIWQVMQSPEKGVFTTDLPGDNNTFICKYSGQDDKGDLFFLIEVENGKQRLIRTQSPLLNYLQLDVPKSIVPKTKCIFINNNELICFQDSARAKYQIFKSKADFTDLQLLPNGLQIRSADFEFNTYFYFFPYQYAQEDGGTIRNLSFTVPPPLNTKQLILASNKKRLLVFYEIENTASQKLGKIKALYELTMGELEWRSLPMLYTPFRIYKLDNRSDQKPALSFSTSSSTSYLTINENVYQLNKDASSWVNYFNYYTDIQESFYYKDTLYVGSNFGYGSLNPSTNTFNIVANTITQRVGTFFIKSDSIFSIDERFCWKNDRKGRLYSDLDTHENNLTKSYSTSQFCISKNEEIVLSIEEDRSKEKKLYYFMPGLSEYKLLESNLASSGTVSNIQFTPENWVIVHMQNGGTWLSKSSFNSLINSIIEDENKQTSQALYPNPCTKELSINITEPLQIAIYDLRGKRRILSKSNKLDISELEPGIYFANITTNGKTTVQKFIKL